MAKTTNKNQKRRRSNANEISNTELSREEMAQCYKDLQDLNDAASAFFRIPVFFSHQNLFTLGPSNPPFSLRQQFVIRMFKEIRKELLFPRTLPNTEEYPNTLLENIRTMINSSYGLASVLLRPTGPTRQGEPYTPLLQIEPSMGFERGLPLLLVIEDGVQAGGIWGGAGPFAPFTPIVWFPSTETLDDFFTSPKWTSALKNWAGQVRSGYFIQTGPEFKYRCNG